MMTFWELQNKATASQERVIALQVELAAEKAKKKALQRALEAAAKKARGRNIYVDQGCSGKWMQLLFCMPEFV